MSKVQRKWIQQDAVSPEQLDLAFPLITRATTEPDDSEVQPGELLIWFDQTRRSLAIKARKGNGRLFVGRIRLRRKR